MLFVCPKCKGQLNITPTCATCALGHSYDKSKKGYFNLLLSRGGGVHGDNKMMVDARRDFLGKGYYAPLAERVADLVLENSPTAAAVLDVGCGEGYYTDYFERALASRDGESNVFGFDISKDAVIRAARKNPALSLAVASAYDMPISDGAVDVAVNMFSPLAREELLRTLKPGGVFIMAIPGKEHLFGLKSALYDTPYKNEVQDTALSGFELLKTENISYNITLDNTEDILNLFRMTPYAYRTSSVGRERIESLKNLETPIEFITFVYKKA